MRRQPRQSERVGHWFCGARFSQCACTGAHGHAGVHVDVHWQRTDETDAQVQSYRIANPGHQPMPDHVVAIASRESAAQRERLAPDSMLLQFCARKRNG